MRILYFFGKHAFQAKRPAFRFPAKLIGSALCGLLLAFPASAEWTYSYTGSPFTHFVDQITDPSGSYTSNMAVSGFFIVENELPKGVWMHDLSSLLTDFEFTDGRQTLTKSNAAIRDFKVATNLDGEIYDWVINVRVENALPDYIGETWGGPIILLGKVNANVTPRYFDLAQITQCSNVFGNEDPPRCQATIWDRGTTNSAKGIWTDSPTSTNEPPTAVAAEEDYSIRAGDTVVLKGENSYDDNTATIDLDYTWSIVESPDGSNPSLTAANTIEPTFFSDTNIVGSYTIELIVTDEGGLSSEPNTVLISTENLAPTANAGADQLVVVGETVNLDGSGSSDPEQDELTYEWSITVPNGSAATLSDHEVADPWFTADEAGTYSATLTVSDFIGPGDPDDVIITAALSAEDYVVLTAGIVAELEAGQVTTKGNQRAFFNFLSQAIRAVQEGDTAEANKKLEDAMKRTDGCVLRGEPDGNGKGRDWITDCDAQANAYELLSSALYAISP